MNGAQWSKEWFDFLIKTGEGALFNDALEREPQMDAGDRAELERALVELREGFARYALGGDAGAEAVGRIMSAAFLIGSFGTVTTSHNNLLVSKPQKVKSLKGVKAKRPKVLEREDEVLRLRSKLKRDDLSKARTAEIIEEQMPESMRLGSRQIQRILDKKKV